jgi:hypothetical protein
MWKKCGFCLFVDIVATPNSEARAEMDPDRHDASISALASDFLTRTTFANRLNDLFSAK